MFIYLVLVLFLTLVSPFGHEAHVKEYKVKLVTTAITHLLKGAIRFHRCSTVS